MLVDMPAGRPPDSTPKPAVDNAILTRLLGHFIRFSGHAETQNLRDTRLTGYPWNPGLPRRHRVTDSLDVVAVRVAHERAEVVVVVLRPVAGFVQDLGVEADGSIEEGAYGVRRLR